MNRWVVGAWLLVSSCSFDGLDFSGGASVLVCVQGDVGRCCLVTSDVCRIGEEGCKPGAPFLRTPSRCLSCLPWEIDDGGVPDARWQPPNPPADARIFWTDDAGVHDAHMQVCGPATYERYTTQ